MMKKLFLFTLLVSSFLVISCNNKDTTAPTVTGVDSKWYGTYDGKATDSAKGELLITILVNSDGITLTKTYTDQNSEIRPISSDLITRVSDSQYKFSNGEETIEFTFDETSVTYHETIGGISRINQNIPEIEQQ